ncbi:MAG: glycosyltransferase family 4 protein [Candidatus Aminicenantes bacterium]
MGKNKKKIVFVYNSASYLYNFRLSLMLSMRKRGWEVMAVSPYDNFASKFRDNGISYLDFPFKRKGRNPLSDLWMLIRLVKFYNREKPIIVHHFTIKPVIYGTLAARICRIPGIVNLVPGLGFVFSHGGLIQKIVESMYRFSLSARVRMIFQNIDDLNFFVKRKLINPKQTHLICGSGINTKLYSLNKYPQDNIPADIIFTLVARMLWDKGISEFVKAAQLVNKKNPHTRFLLIGDPDRGNPTSIPVSWLKNLQNLNYIKWIKHTDDIKPYLAKSSVIVLPSYREGAPRSLIEAASMSKPIIAADVPGCREIVKSNVNGLLVPKKNITLLAKAMLTLADNPSQRRKMGLASREIALKCFDERLINRKTIKIYRELR